MTPDERSILTSFLADIANTPRPNKDAEADAMITEAVRANPDAAYLLVQHAILADQALHAAHAGSASFLPQPPATAVPTQPVASPWAGPAGAPVQASPWAANSGLGGFLRNAGQMAVGVAAGDFLFQGIENIFGPRW
jgi:hypothetical protein